MLKANPTRKGTGISIYGDYADLSILHDVIHNIANSLNEDNEFQKGQFLLLMNFAYEIRKAKEGSRLIEKLEIENDTVTYFGTQFVWTDIILFSNVLRDNAGYLSLNKLEQSFIYLLEYNIEMALVDYDAEGGNKLKYLIGNGLFTNQKYIFQIYQTMHVDFVSKTGGKKRFRSLYNFLIDYLSTHSETHKNIMKQYEISAKQYGCNILELEINDYPEIDW